MTGSTPTTPTAKAIDGWVNLLPDTLDLGPGFRSWFSPFAKNLSGPWGTLQEKARIGTRHLPPLVRPLLDQLQNLISVPQTLGLAHRDLLLESMKLNGVERSVVTFAAQTGSPDALISFCKGHPLIPVIDLGASPLDENSSAQFKNWSDLGVQCVWLKADHPTPLEVLALAQEHSFRVIASNESGTRFESIQSWVRGFEKIPFALIQMNRHEPMPAIELAKECTNLWLMTGSQPAEILGEAVRVLGSSRLLWSSDWPALPDAQARSLDVLREAIQAEWMTASDFEAITDHNPRRFFL
jgi:hypothetical protein